MSEKDSLDNQNLDVVMLGVIYFNFLSVGCWKRNFSESQIQFVNCQCTVANVDRESL